MPDPAQSSSLPPTPGMGWTLTSSPQKGEAAWVTPARYRAWKPGGSRARTRGSRLSHRRQVPPVQRGQGQRGLQSSLQSVPLPVTVI